MLKVSNLSYRLIDAITSLTVTNRIDSEIQPVTSFSSSYLTDQLSSSSDSVTEKSAGTASSRSHHSKERKSRITSQRESDKGK